VSRWWLPIGVLAGVVVLLLVIGDGDDNDHGAPLSAEGTGPAGAKAMVLLLDELGASVDVDVEVPTSATDTAVLLRDRLDDTRRQALLDWVADGGTLVVADPSSPLTPSLAEPIGVLGLSDIELHADECDLADLVDVESLRPGGGTTYQVGAGDGSCFGDGESAYVVTRSHAAGLLVGVGSAGPFTNELLDDVDNAVLVAQLLAPQPEGTRVAFLDQLAVPENAPGEGDDTLAELIPDRILVALLQLALAFLVYVAFRARRAGHPVTEPLPTTIAGSELVAAVGELRQQEQAPERSAAILRDDLHRTLARRLGIPPDAPLDDVVAVAERAGADADRLRRVLAGPPVTDGEQLTELARDIDLTRQEVLHEQQ
jgi:hypothetical protein